MAWGEGPARVQQYQVFIPLATERMVIVDRGTKGSVDKVAQRGTIDEIESPDRPKNRQEPSSYSING